jgi:hypothetical protein
MAARIAISGGRRFTGGAERDRIVEAGRFPPASGKFTRCRRERVLSVHRMSRVLSFAHLPEAAVLALAAALLCTAVGAGYAAGKPAAPDTASGARAFSFSAWADATGAAPACATSTPFFSPARHGHYPSLMFVPPPTAAIHVQLPLLTVAPASITSPVAAPEAPPPRLLR